MSTANSRFIPFFLALFALLSRCESQASGGQLACPGYGWTLVDGQCYKAFSYTSDQQQAQALCAKLLPGGAVFDSFMESPSAPNLAVVAEEEVKMVQMLGVKVPAGKHSGVICKQAPKPLPATYPYDAFCALPAGLAQAPQAVMASPQEPPVAMGAVKIGRVANAGEEDEEAAGGQDQSQSRRSVKSQRSQSTKRRHESVVGEENVEEDSQSSIDILRRQKHRKHHRGGGQKIIVQLEERESGSGEQSSESAVVSSSEQIELSESSSSSVVQSGDHQGEVGTQSGRQFHTASQSHRSGQQQMSEEASSSFSSSSSSSSKSSSSKSSSSKFSDSSNGGA